MLEINNDIELARYSTLGVGGNADYLAITSTQDDLLAALNWADKEKVPFVIIGKGSNLLISDEGFRGLVIINRILGYEIIGDRVEVNSGECLSKVALETLKEGLLGLHFGAGIPGTIGGAVADNSGALGYDISETLVSARVWQDGVISTWENGDFTFSYRSSKLKGGKNTVILSAVFELTKGDTKSELQIIEEDKKRRLASYIGRTCGSYFKNPEGKSAGELIDSLGLKGFRQGGAEVSPEHANVLRNADSATANDFLILEETIIDKVREKYGIELETEVVKLGF